LIATTVIGARAQMPAPTPEAAAQRFSTRADIVLVDVAVLDNRGRPVTDLTAADFSVSVAGRPRPIQSAQFVVSNPATSIAAPATPRDAGSTTNTLAGSGRLLLIVVDEANLRFGAGRAVVRSAEGLLSRLAPGDLVGVLKFPGGGGVEFTTNRTRVIESLGQVTGRNQPSLGLSVRVYLAEAADLERGGRGEWTDALLRECGQPSGGPDYEVCVSAMETSASDVLQTESAKARDTMRRLEAVIKGLAAAQAPVNLVFISEGLFLGRDPALLTGISAAAANARVTLNVVRPAPELFGAAERGAPPSLSLDDAHKLGLEMLAGTLRGGFYQVSGNGAAAFDRISMEWSGHYLLGIAPLDEDRTGRERRLRVEVNRKGLTVRGRPHFVVREDADEAPLGAPAQLQRILAAPLATPGLPIKVATYNLTNEADDRVRVLISAEIGEGMATTADLNVGVLVLDANGTVVRNSAGAGPISPVDSRSPSPGLYLTSVVLPPGEYSLRLGAIDATGLAGSVHHPIAARLTPTAGGLHLSDLIVAPAPGPGQVPQVSPSAVIADQRLTVVLEGRLADAARLARVVVRFEVTKEERDPAIVQAAASPATSSDTRRTFSGSLGVGAVPPGEYLLRAVIAEDGGRETTMVRPFRLEGEPGKRITAGAPVTTTNVPPPIPAPTLTVPRLAFKMEDVLRPELVRSFIEGLQARHPPSASLQAVVNQAKEGIFPTGNLEVQGQSAAMATFLGGLAALKAGRIPQATALFQQTLKAAPTFIGVAFYLGACHAANGQDREAIGAWQMSLLSEGATGVYPVLVDALLRVGETKKALDFIEESPASWGRPADRMRREAIAFSKSARYDEALPLIVSLVEQEPGNSGLLFLGLQLLYRAHLERGLSDADRGLFRNWAKQYQDVTGPELGLVQAWLASVAP